MVKEFYFYYDEAQHSRVINKATFNADNYYDNFIVSIIGWEKSDNKGIVERYLAFEEKYSERKSGGEIKSTTLSTKHFKNGFASLSHNTDFVYDYLDIFDDKMFIYISVISKVEYLVRQMFANYENNIFQNIDAMQYTIVKSIITYKPENVIKAFFDSPLNLVQELKRFYIERIEINKNNLSLKEQENKAFSQILILLGNINKDIRTSWNYNISLHGFTKYIKEKGIKNFTLFIDRESDGKTLNAAKEVGVLNAEEVDSKESVGVRIADMFAGITSKLLIALKKALKYSKESEQLQKKLLNTSWFRINERQFQLYKKLAHIILRLNNAYYKSFGGVYSDDLISFVAFLGYIDSHKTLDEFNKKSELHGEYLNACILKSLHEHFKRTESKLPIDFVEDTGEGYYFNQRGAKTYFDESKQPMLNITKEGSTYEVLSIGFQKETPLVTIKEKDGTFCYKLPKELFEWAFHCVAFANIGMNSFPAKVCFKKRGKGYSANKL